ncbi:hypothetical protein VHEMI01964 [[Torrubiella] hemipterigena]|uniref:Zn(2)-C6 fungal-type domain-containing protein n=1 Tax=[Torrubiella] hemipterigena TaxID=1531966 RepID=A0A0A1T6C2_9HYPO|nr:hypothetical protein VHEMI01964 [[Torrubiella] hemipterigena]
MSSPTLSKTCQTCFKAKIRCEKTQASGRCDRCLRLGKSCVFPPSKRPPKTHRTSNAEFFESSAYGSGTPSSDYPSSPAAGGHASGISIINPIEVGIMSATEAEAQILEYQTVFTQRFPFVVVPVTTSVQHCWQQHPLVCLAVLAVTSRDDTKRQKTLFKLLNEAVASRLVNGTFTSLDLLQALLIQVAWSHYEPHPKRNVQHLALACSVINELKLYRPKTPRSMALSTENDGKQWTPDEVRAVCGTFFLSSSYAMLSNKHRTFPFTSYLVDASEEISQLNLTPTDRSIPWLIQLQKYAEDLEDLMTDASIDSSYRLGILFNSLTQVKMALSLPSADSSLTHLQLQLLDVMLAQCSVKLPSFHLHKLTTPVAHAHLAIPTIASWLIGVVDAVKSLCKTMSSLPINTISILSTIDWLIFYNIMSLAAQLDLLSCHPVLADPLAPSRADFNVANLIQKTILVLETAIAPISEDPTEPDALNYLANRFRKLEQSYNTYRANNNIGFKDGSISLTLHHQEPLGYQSQLLLTELITKFATEVQLDRPNLYEMHEPEDTV